LRKGVDGVFLSAARIAQLDAAVSVDALAAHPMAYSFASVHSHSFI
jgi:hypothetical protein